MQSQQQAQRDFIARAKMLAHVMTSSKNITVTISGDTAYCSFGHINLPAGDYTDPSFRKMVQGWIDHELGHEDESKRCHIQEASGHKVLSDIFGRVEDVRMETSRGIKFRGARTNLAVLAELAIERGLFNMPQQDYDIGRLIMNHLLYRGRSVVIGQHCLDTFSSVGHTLIADKLNQQFADGLNQLIDKIATLTSSQGSLDLAREILAFIEQEDQNQQQQNNQADNEASQNDSDNQDSQSEPRDSDNQPSDDNQSDLQDSDQASDNETQTDNESTDSDNGNSSAPSATSDDTGDDTQPSDSDSHDGNQSASDTDNSDSQAACPSTSELQQPIKLIKSLADCDVKDFHEAIAQMISDDVAEKPTQTSLMPEFDFVEDASDYYFDASALDVSLAKRLSGNVFQALHKVLIDIQPELPVTRKRGKRINGRLFSGIPAGNMKVFHSHVEQEVREAAVTLVIDASPSMRGDPIKHANTCALAFAMALQRLDIAFEVVYYGSKKERHFQMYRPKTFDSSLKITNFEVYSGNYSTPTGEAMQFALSSLVLRKESNKLMLLLTDGDPDCPERVQQSHQLAKSFGVSVVPFALCTDFVRGFEKHEFVSIKEPTALTPALRQATKQKLFA